MVGSLAFSIINDHISFKSSSGVADTISNVTSTISDIFNNVGAYCVEWANGGLAVFQWLVSSARDLLTFSTDDSTFSDFSHVIDQVSSVLTVIASSLLVLFFLTSLASDSWETQHDFDLWGFAKDLVKLIVSVVVVNNAIYLTKLIFNAGAGIAEFVAYVGNISKYENVADNIQLDSDKVVYLANGVSGIRGVFILIAYVLGAIVITVCGVMVTIEIYQRILKIYILIPLSTLSFSTFAIGNRSGVFSGYVKSICQVSLEAFVIMLAICFTYRLCDNSKIMQKMFPADVIGPTAVAVKTMDDYIVLNAFLNSYNLTYNEKTESNGFADYINDIGDGDLFSSGNDITYLNKDNITPGVLATLDRMSSPPSLVTRNFNKKDKAEIVEKSAINNLIKANHSNTTVKLRSCYFHMYPEVSVKDALLLLIQIVFPCMLCVGVVKAAGSYSAMAVGKG